MRWSGYPQLELTNEVAEVARAASAIEDASGLGRLELPRDSMEVWQAHTDPWTAPGPLGLPPP